MEAFHKGNSFSFEVQNPSIADVGPCCPLCESADRKLVRIEPEGELVRCRECKLLYVYPRPSSNELKAIYDDEYFSNGDLASCLSFRTPVFRECLSHLKHLSVRSGRLLDVGCGTGEFVVEALSQGWQAVGIESSKMAANFAREYHQVPVFNSVLETAPFSPASFDVVTMLDVLEHLLEPRKELQRVYNLLQPRGIVVVRVPNTVFHLPKARACALLGVSQSSLEMRYHLNHFTPQTLSELLHRVGFEVLSVEVGASETKAHATWASPTAKRMYVGAARLLRSLTGMNLGNIMIAYGRRSA
jgi:2-polyprenyl-3-methyl-5-hydroxy-6-metoxy-1,4-benzoquinol methylase